MRKGNEQMKIGFDNDKYLKMQSEHIRERINQFGNKLYLEFGGKLFDDYHASRVLPGFEPDSKLRMLMQLSDQAEIVIVISAADIDKNKVRGDLGITYDEDVLRLMEVFTERGLYVGSVCITQYSGQESADAFKKRLEKLGIKVYVLYLIPGYPNNTSFIVRDMARTIISKQQDHWLSSLLQDPEAEKWPPAFLSFTMNTSAVSRQDMPNLKLSQSGISR